MNDSALVEDEICDFIRITRFRPGLYHPIGVCEYGSGPQHFPKPADMLVQ
jgi:hypothetical protein